ncbi:hypothetical protein [Coleofasciculus sp. FACHB-SPT9]|nr:hypothetical protein [Coleofasciculus sp. FACHB-SPT9]MBD1892932.1 hypothetical protein [Coleofasciculus sp. FACHB-SPT9]
MTEAAGAASKRAGNAELQAMASHETAGLAGVEWSSDHILDEYACNP